MPYGQDYRAAFTEGGHRSQAEESLAKEAREKLILFDVIDPRLVWLHRIHYLGKTTQPQPSWLKIVRRALRVRRGAAARRRKGEPPYEMGHAHHPATIAEIATQSGLDMEYVTSMYYNYRYHAILTRSTPPSASAAGSAGRSTATGGT